MVNYCAVVDCDSRSDKAWKFLVYIVLPALIGSSIIAFLLLTSILILYKQVRPLAMVALTSQRAVC